MEVERLDKLKANKTKELVMKKKEDLDEICRQAHMNPDQSTSEESLMAIIDSGGYCIYRFVVSFLESILESKNKELCCELAIDDIGENTKISLTMILRN